MVKYTDKRIIRTLLVLFIFVLTLSSCQKYVKYCIDDGDYKYWYVQKGSNIYMYFFDNNGYCSEFKKSLFSSLRLYISDDIRDNKWALQSCSKLRFDGCEYKIVIITPDLMVLKNDNDVKVLMSAPLDAIPQKFRHKGPFEFETSKKRNFWVKPGTKPFYWDE